MAAHIYIKENSIFARLAAKKLRSGRMAMVIGKTIHLHNVSAEDFLKTRRWLRHELKHIEQYKQHGLIKFLWLYLKESLKNGYHGNKFEVEARAAEADTTETLEYIINGKTIKC